MISASFLLSFGVALFIQIYIQSRDYTISHHTFEFSPGFFILWAAVLAVVLSFWAIPAAWESRRLSMDSASLRWRRFLVLLPLVLFPLTPWLLRYYLTREDLRIRLRLLAVFVFLAVFFLTLIRFDRLLKSVRAAVERTLVQFSSFSRRRRLLILFFIAFFLYQAVAVMLVSRGRTFTGDEPSYLMASHSLLNDRDINLANNYAKKDYFSFYSKKDHPLLKLEPFGHYGRKGRNAIYPVHLPGISVLMLPFYWLSQFFSGKWLTYILKASLSPWAALLGLQVYLFTKELWGREKLALGLWASYSFSSPILFFAVHLYPEVPIALFSLTIFRKVSSSAALSRLQLFFLGFVLALFPWFGVKFVLLFASLFLVSLFFLIREHKGRSTLLFFMALPLVSIVLFFIFLYALYGTFSPLAFYRGVLTPEQSLAVKQTLLSVPLRARVESLLGYFLDQRDGLLLYSPLYFFAFFGLLELWRRKRKEFWSLLIIAFPFLFSHAFLLERPGACPQGRVLTSLSWIAAICLGYFLVYNRRKIFSFLFALACGVSFLVAGLLLSHPSFLYQPTTREFTSRPGDLFIHLSNLHFFLPPFLPSFIKVDNSRYWPNYLWVLALTAFILAYALSRREKALARRLPVVFVSVALAVCFFLWALFPRPALFPAKTVRYSSQRALRFSLYPVGNGVLAKEGGDFYLHQERRSTFLFSSRTKLDRVKLRYGSEKGEYSLKMAFFDIPLHEDRTIFEVKEHIFEPVASYRYRHLFIYAIDLSLIHHTSELMLSEPFLFQIIPWKE